MDSMTMIKNEQETIKEKTIEFKDGLPGFYEYKNYVIILNEDEENPFHKLQSIEEPELSFIIISPFIFKSNYEFEIPKPAIEKLRIEKESDLAIYTIVRVPENYHDMTANLQAPIIINTKTMLGKQVILDDNRYNTKHLVLEEMNRE